MRPSLRSCVTALAVAFAAASTPIGAGAVWAADPMVGAPVVGQCHDYDYEAVFTDTAPGGLVDCAQRHTAITVAVVSLPDGLPFTGNTDKAFDYLIEQCDSAFETAIGIPHKLQHITAVTRNVYLPPPALAAQGARWGQCDLVSFAGKALAPIAATTPLVTTSTPKGALLRCLRKDYRPTNCTRSHAWEPTGVITLPGSSFPAKAAQQQFGKRRCGARTNPGHRYVFIPISRESWKSGERHIACWQEGH